MTTSEDRVHVYLAAMWPIDGHHDTDSQARAVIAVADAEQAEQRAAIARVEALRDDLERGSTSVRRNPRLARRINAALLGHAPTEADGA